MTGSGWLITAPSAVTSTVTVVPGVVCRQRPGPSTHAVPSEGWPANGISYAGVKMRIEYAPAPVMTGNVVSLKFTSRATAAMRGSGQGSSTTQSALPESGRSVKTSTMR